MDLIFDVSLFLNRVLSVSHLYTTLLLTDSLNDVGSFPKELGSLC